MIDLPGVYLNSIFPADQPPVYICIDKEMSTIALNIKSDYVKYTRDDGTSVVANNIRHSLVKSVIGICSESISVVYNSNR